MSENFKDKAKSIRPSRMMHRIRGENSLIWRTLNKLQKFFASFPPRPARLRESNGGQAQHSPFKGEGGEGVRYRTLVVILLFIMTGCGTPRVGLQPEYPPFKKGMFALWGKFVEVDSLQPTLKWESFPRQEDGDVDQEGLLNRIEDVTYELRIWKTLTASSGELVYARDGLKLPSHRLEEFLEPSTQYLWSVRAHFMLDGHPRTIEWGLAGFLLRGEVVPNPSCFRFVTPSVSRTD